MQSEIENLKSKIIPPFLKPGDLLRVIAPSGALREFATFEKGVEIWRSRGYKVEISPQIDDKWGYLAGKDETRRNQLAAAWQDPECRGILCARGGFGSTRILENWNWGVGERRSGGQERQGGRQGDKETRRQEDKKNNSSFSPSPPPPISPSLTYHDTKRDRFLSLWGWSSDSHVINRNFVTVDFLIEYLPNS